MKKTIELQPCHQCESTDIGIEVDEPKENNTNKNIYSYVRCKNCDYLFHLQLTSNDILGIIEKWNYLNDPDRVKKEQLIKAEELEIAALKIRNKYR